jgi:integrase
MPKPTEYLENWKHGFIRVDRRGRKMFYIREMVHGRRRKVSTRAHTIEGAMEAYALWAKDPVAFVKQKLTVAHPQPPPDLTLTRELVDDFLEWSEKKGFRGYGNSLGHVANQRIAMDFWQKHLGRRHLRTVNLERDVLPPLQGQAQQANRRRTLKAFFSWLRSEDGGNRLRLAEDPLARALRVPKSNPAQRAKPNKAVPWDDLIKVRDGARVKGKGVPGLQAHWRAAFVIQMETGWHNTELRRFAVDGSIEPYVGKQTGAAAVLMVQHKSGSQHRSAVSAAAVAAARELQGYGTFEPANYSREVKRVAGEVGVSEFTAGQLRHSVATKMINDGADLATVSTFLGHRSPQTTKGFYVTHAVPLNPALGPPPTVPAAVTRRKKPSRTKRIKAPA